MAYFAKLDETNKVIAVVKVANAALDPENEDISGIEFLTTTFGHTMWKQTSYNNNMRKQYAGQGYTYDPVADVFVCPSPYPSWILDDNHDWQAPTPMPETGNYWWNETTQLWVEQA